MIKDIVDPLLFHLVDIGSFFNCDALKDFKIYFKLLHILLIIFIMVKCENSIYNFNFKHILSYQSFVIFVILKNTNKLNRKIFTLPITSRAAGSCLFGRYASLRTFPKSRRSRKKPTSSWCRIGVSLWPTHLFIKCAVSCKIDTLISNIKNRYSLCARFRPAP